MNKELNLLNSRKKYIVTRINDITKLSNIHPSLTRELRELINEYKILEETTNKLHLKTPEKKKCIKYPHEFYRDKMKLFFSNS